MNTFHTHPSRKAPLRRALVVALAGAGALLAITSVPALARERVTTVTGAQGQTVQRQVVRQRGQVSSSTTGPNGQTTSRSVVRADGTATATLTGPQGKTATRTVTRQP